MTQDTNLDLDLDVVELGVASVLTEGEPQVPSEDNGALRQIF
jgi:hypothetical protein